LSQDSISIPVQKVFHVLDASSANPEAREFYLLWETLENGDNTETVQLVPIQKHEQYNIYAKPETISIAEFIKLMSPWINFVKEKQKRHKWPDSFLNKHEETAKENLFRSRYHVVRDLRNPNKILSTIRWINEWYPTSNKVIYIENPLPESKYLGIKMPTLRSERLRQEASVVRGLNTEIGFWAIDENLPIKLRRVLWRNQWSKFLEIAFDSGQPEIFNILYHRYFTYADKYSLEVYGKPMGFRVSGPSITREGVVWQPLELSLEAISKFQEELEEGKRKQVDRNDAVNIRRMAGMKIPNYLNLTREVTMLFLMASREGLTESLRKRTDKFLDYLNNRQKLLDEAQALRGYDDELLKQVNSFLLEKDKLLNFIKSSEELILRRSKKGERDFLLYLHERLPVDERHHPWGLAEHNRIDLLSAALIEDVEMSSLIEKLIVLRSLYFWDKFHINTLRVNDYDYLLPKERARPTGVPIMTLHESIEKHKLSILESWNDFYEGEEKLKQFSRLLVSALNDPNDINKINELKIFMSKLPMLKPVHVVDALFWAKENTAPENP
jgi:hypothetical protein